jgi:hypothetical protein
LATGINGEDIDRFGFAMHCEQDAPAADAGLSNSGPIGERRGQARIEGVNRKLRKASPNTLFSRPVKNDRGTFRLRERR